MRLFQSNQQEIINVVFHDFSLFWELTLDNFLLINFCMKNYIDILKFFRALLWRLCIANNYMLQVNNRNSVKMYGIWSKSFWCLFIVNFEHIYTFYSLSIMEFEQINVCWGNAEKTCRKLASSDGCAKLIFKYCPLLQYLRREQQRVDVVICFIN